MKSNSGSSSAACTTCRSQIFSLSVEAILCLTFWNTSIALWNAV